MKKRYRATEIYSAGTKFLFWPESGILMTQHASHSVPTRLDLVSEFDGEIDCPVSQEEIVGVFSAKKKLYLVCNKNKIYQLSLINR